MLHENFKQSQSVTVFKTKPTLTSFNGPLHHEITDAFRDFTVLMPYAANWPIYIRISIHGFFTSFTI
jgi:hypothetical protein